MSDLLQLKQAAFDFCNAVISNRINTIEAILKSLEESRNSESKSSVGDKYETGRAMIQLEEEKNKTQLIEALAAKSVLESIKLDNVNAQVITGSLVITNTNKYFIAIGVGKIIIASEVIYGISIDSPIGQILKNKKAGAEVVFKEQLLKIETIV